MFVTRFWQFGLSLLSGVKCWGCAPGCQEEVGLPPTPTLCLLGTGRTCYFVTWKLKQEAWGFGCWDCDFPSSISDWGWEMRIRQYQLLCQGPCYSPQNRNGRGSCIPFEENIFSLALVHWAFNNMIYGRGELQLNWWVWFRQLFLLCLWAGDSEIRPIPSEVSNGRWSPRMVPLFIWMIAPRNIPFNVQDLYGLSVPTAGEGQHEVIYKECFLMQRKTLIQSMSALELLLENEQRWFLVGSGRTQTRAALTAFPFPSTPPSWLLPSASQDSILSGLCS